MRLCNSLVKTVKDHCPNCYGDATQSERYVGWLVNDQQFVTTKSDIDPKNPPFVRDDYYPLNEFHEENLIDWIKQVEGDR